MRSKPGIITRQELEQAVQIGVRIAVEERPAPTMPAPEASFEVVLSLPTLTGYAAPSPFET